MQISPVTSDYAFNGRFIKKRVIPNNVKEELSTSVEQGAKKIGPKIRKIALPTLMGLFAFLGGFAVPNKANAQDGYPQDTYAQDARGFMKSEERSPISSQGNIRTHYLRKNNAEEVSPENLTLANSYRKDAYKFMMSRLQNASSSNDEVSKGVLLDKSRDRKLNVEEWLNLMDYFISLRKKYDSDDALYYQTLDEALQNIGEEFRNPSRQEFAAIDLNNDEFIDPEELATLMAYIDLYSPGSKQNDNGTCYDGWLSGRGWERIITIPPETLRKDLESIRKMMNDQNSILNSTEHFNSLDKRKYKLIINGKVIEE